MNEPEPTANDAELAEYYDQHRDLAEWDEPRPLQKPERLDVTLSVRFTSSEIAHIRDRAEAAGLKPTSYIRHCALAAEQTPIDRGGLSRAVAALSHDLDELRRAAG
jgi:hypothetical protein